MSHDSNDCDLHELTLAELLTPAEGALTVWSIDHIRTGALGSVQNRAWAAVKARELRLRERAVACGVDGYLVAAEGGQWADGVIAVYEARTGACVGGYARSEPVFERAHRDIGLEEEVTMLAWGRRMGKATGVLTPNAMQSLIHAHRRAVVRAQAAGLAVRGDVLADYPDLARRARAAA